MANLKIKTPNGFTYQSPTAGAAFSWNSTFGPDMTRRFTQAQKFIDIACELLRVEIMGNLDCDALARYIQSEEKYLKYDKLVSQMLQTGMLQKSGITGTIVGSGEVTYTAPYAARQYYHTAKSRSYDANRGSYWFERGKAAEKQRILQGARKLAGGK